MDQYLQFFSHHWELTMVFIVALIAIIAVEFQSKAGGIALISPEDAVQLINREDAVVVDLRDKALFNEGHIINAISISLNHAATADKLKPYHNHPVILVCSNGQNSGKASNILKKEGFTKLSILKNGIGTWRSAGLPLVKK